MHLHPTRRILGRSKQVSLVEELREAPWQLPGAGACRVDWLGRSGGLGACPV